MKRREFLKGFFTGAPIIALSSIAMAEVHQQVKEVEKNVRGGPFPLKVLEIKGADGKVHQIPAWT